MDTHPEKKLQALAGHSTTDELIGDLPPDRQSDGGRAWIGWAVSVLNDPANRPVDPPLLSIDCPELPGIEIYVKDETRHPTGSLKHRLAHALLVHAICNGDVVEGTPLVEASSGSTAISEAWFAAKLGLRFIAVVPATTAAAKLAAIEALGGEVVLVEGQAEVSAMARKVAAEAGGHFLDQFTNAAVATDWRGVNSIAETLFSQMRSKRHPMPRWVVVGAGTGGTSTTIGRYIRFRPELAGTRLCVVDPEGSAFFRAYATGDRAATGRPSCVVEGIGRARVEPSFQPQLVDRMLSIPDAGSVAAAQWLLARTGRAFGPSTGTNVIGCLMLAQSMARQGACGSIVTLGCDDGARYASTVYDAEWLKRTGVDVTPWAQKLDRLGDPDFALTAPAQTRRDISVGRGTGSAG